MEKNAKTIWDLRDEKLKSWWELRDELAEHVHQDGLVDLEKVLEAFTNALNKLDEQLTSKN